MNIDSESLYEWLNEMPISRQKRNIHRDFSDAVPMAELLKHLYPKMVELHNYTPANTYAKKLVNWEILNKRVLSKLKLAITSDSMEKLARGEPGEIEKLLISVKADIESKRAGDMAKRKNDALKILKYSKGDLLTLRTKSANEKTDQNKQKEDMEYKDHIIKNLTTKVNNLEHTLKIRNQRISELRKQLEANMNEPQFKNSPRPTFFRSIFS